MHSEKGGGEGTWVGMMMKAEQMLGLAKRMRVSTRGIHFSQDIGEQEDGKVVMSFGGHLH